MPLFLLILIISVKKQANKNKDVTNSVTRKRYFIASLRFGFI